MHCPCGVCQYRGRSGKEPSARPFSSSRPLRPGNENGPMRMSVQLMRVAIDVVFTTLIGVGSLCDVLPLNL